MKAFKIVRDDWFGFFAEEAPDLMNLVQKLFLFYEAGIIYLEGKNFSFFRKLIFKFFFYTLEFILVILTKWVLIRFYLNNIFWALSLVVCYLRLVFYFVIRFCRILYFSFFHPVLSYRSLQFFRYKREKTVRWFFVLLQENIQSTFNLIYLKLDHQFAEYEEDVMYGAPKAEREQWFFTSYEFLAAKKKLTERFSSLLQKITWEKDLRYNYFVWLPSFKGDTLRTQLKNFRVKAQKEYEKKVQDYIVYLKEKKEYERYTLSKSLKLIFRTLFFFFEYFLLVLLGDYFSVWLFIKRILWILFYKIDYFISFCLALVNYLFLVWLPMLIYDLTVLVIGLPLRFIFLSFFTLIYIISEKVAVTLFIDGLFATIFKKGVMAKFLFFVSGSFQKLYLQYENLVQNYSVVPDSWIPENYLDDEDLPLFFYSAYEFYLDSFEWVVTEELDEAFIEVLQKYGQFVYIKRSVSNFLSSFFSSLVSSFFQQIFFLNKIYFIFLPFVEFVSFFGSLIISFLWFFLFFSSWLFFIVIKSIFYVWFNSGTRLSFFLYSLSFEWAERFVKDGKLFFSIFFQYICPVIIDFVRLSIKTLLVGSLCLLFWVVWGPDIVILLKTYPKWFKHYVFLLYILYFIAGACLAVLSRKCYEAYLEGLDYVIENFIFIFFSINILNFLMAPPWYFRYFRQDAMRWHYRWRNRRNRLPFSYREYFDKGAWQMYSDRRYIPRIVWDCLEDRERAVKFFKKFL